MSIDELQAEIRGLGYSIWEHGNIIVVSGNEIRFSYTNWDKREALQRAYNYITGHARVP